MSDDRFVAIAGLRRFFASFDDEDDEDDDGPCEGCDELGATCIVCDREWCAACWDSDEHVCIRPPADGEVPF